MRSITLLGLALAAGCATPEPSGRNHDDDDRVAPASCELCDHVRAACEGVTSCDCSVQVPLEIEACVLDAISCEAVVACLEPGGGECTCDATYGCDADCACDPECEGAPIGSPCSCAPEPGLVYCSNAACETAYCLWSDGFEQYCSRPCAADSDCPAGMQCVWFQGTDPWCAYLP
jgi:hypothetical protein